MFRALTKGYVALVSPGDTEILMETSWRVHWNPRYRYVTVLSSNGGASILSRRVLNAKPGQLVDHANRDTADCRRENLRIATPSQNQANRRRDAGKLLPKGVQEAGSRFSAVIVHQGGRLYLGRFDTPEAASRAYEFAAITLFGDFARAE